MRRNAEQPKTVDEDFWEKMVEKVGQLTPLRIER